eukprot:3572459-Prymnesium_polylepis.1
MTKTCPPWRPATSERSRVSTGPAVLRLAGSDDGGNGRLTGAVVRGEAFASVEAVGLFPLCPAAGVVASSKVRGRPTLLRARSISWYNPLSCCAESDLPRAMPVLYSASVGTLMSRRLASLACEPSF